MKKLLLPLFVILLAGQIIAQPPAPLKDAPSRERSRDYDVLHNRIELKIDPEKKALSGKNTITLVPLRTELKVAELDASSLKVTDVMDSRGFPLEYLQTDENLFVTLSKTSNSNDTTSFTIHYYLSKPVSGLKFIDAEGDRPLQVISACFPNKASEWIPCYDFPNDKATQEMIITTQSKYKVLSNGSLIDKTTNPDGTTTWHWNQENPHPTYLINLSIAEYLVVNDSLGDLPVNYWVYPSMADRVERVFGKTPDMIQFYIDTYNCDFPWEKYDQVVSSYLTGGAEATSATIIGEPVVTDEYSEQDYPRDFVVAHEIAHQWWGDLITCRSWEHTWLNESFGTYSDHLYTEAFKGELEGAYDLLYKKNTYLDEFHNRFQRPIIYYDYENPGDNFNHHTYQKGACTLHLLRYILGDETFFRTISTFLNRHAYQSVSTYDFMKCVKDVSGRNMDWFFYQYFFKPGHPVLNITKSWNNEEKELKVTITQEQDKYKDVPIYTLPVRLGIFNGASKEVKEFWITEKEETITMKLDAEPDMVRFDDGNYLLKEWTYKKDLNELLFQIKHDDLDGRIWAVQQLSNYSNQDEAISTWKNIAKNDSFWAVRAEAVKQFGIFHGKENVAFMKECATDERSKVREQALIALGSLEDPDLVDYFKNVIQKENSYAVKIAAVNAIGKIGNKSDIAFLHNAGNQYSYRDFVKAASVEAIKLIESKY